MELQRYMLVIEADVDARRYGTPRPKIDRLPTNR
jgi:hypothetical protein